MLQVLLVWIVGALLILAHCADQTGATTLQEVLEGVYGRLGLYACSAVVALYCLGCCITFLIIIGDQFDRGTRSMYFYFHWIGCICYEILFVNVENKLETRGNSYRKNEETPRRNTQKLD